MTTCCSSSRSIVHRGLVSVLVVSALCAAAFVGGEGAGVPATSRGLDPAALFPASTVMTLSIDGGPCTEHAKELAISKIWNEPEVQEFLKGSLDLLKEQAETNIKGFTAQLGITPADLDQLAKIRITFAVTQFKLAEGGMSGMPTVDLMLAVDLKGQQKTMEALLKMLEAAAGAGEEGAIKEATVGGIPARMIPVPPGGPFTGVTYLFHEGWLLAGTSTAQTRGGRHAREVWRPEGLARLERLLCRQREGGRASEEHPLVLPGLLRRDGLPGGRGSAWNEGDDGRLGARFHEGSCVRHGSRRSFDS